MKFFETNGHPDVIVCIVEPRGSPIENRIPGKFAGFASIDHAQEFCEKRTNAPMKWVKDGDAIVGRSGEGSWYIRPLPLYDVHAIGVAEDPVVPDTPE